MSSTGRDAVLRALDRQVERLGRRIDALKETSRRFSWGRLAILVGAVGASFLAYRLGGELACWITIALSAAIFIAVAMLHRRVERGLARQMGWREIKAAHAARVRLHWEKIPRSSASASDPEHPFEADLDLSGPRSLHHLLDTAVTAEGSHRLREWLLEPPADLSLIDARRELVRELAPLTIFRDKLALHTRLVSRRSGEQWEASALLESFGEAAPALGLGRVLIAASIVAATTIILFTLSIAGSLPPFWYYSFALYALILLWKKNVTKETLEQALSIELALSKFTAGFRHVESFGFPGCPGLRSLCAPFLDRSISPSRQLGTISRIVEGASFQANPLLWLLVNAVAPLNLYLAYRLARSREALAVHLPRWLDIWFELEALGSLANFAELNPDCTFPEVTPHPADGGAVFAAREIGHPLIPHERRARNDFAFETMGDITLITGSNMAGKSTFLRTLGINLVLAYAGGPVDAAALSAIPFRIFTSIRINDSLTDGFSFFYAEVRRLRRLLTELEEPAPLPLFFLVDEIFRGTNNRERLIGSSSYIRALAGGRGVGIIATHDLELVHLAETIPSITNRHFRERVEDGRMVFDYKLRPGPSPTTNALVIMRMAGLPVEEGERTED
jgi:hypothetical protein